MIRFEDVSYRVGSKALVESIDLTAEAGKMTVVIGPNGAGKSTLLALAAGDLVPSSGQVSFGGRALVSISDEDLARERAVLRQSSTLDFSFTVLDVVLMGRSPHTERAGLRRDLEVAERCLRALDLEAERDRDFTTLSGGEKARVHLARALAQVGLGEEGKALLLDEPTAALDPAHQHRALAVAREVASKGLAVLAVVHDPNLASRYADQVVVLSRGRLARAGAPRDVFSVEMFREVFEVEAHVGPAPFDADLPWVSVAGISTASPLAKPGPARS